MHFDNAQVLSLVIGVVLPLLTGLVTRETANAGVRAVVLAVLATTTSFLTEWAHTLAAHTPFDVGGTLLTVLGTFLVAVGMHFGLWQATGASAAVKRAGGFIGPKTPTD